MKLYELKYFQLFYFLLSVKNNAMDWESNVNGNLSCRGSSGLVLGKPNYKNMKDFEKTGQK